MSGVSTREIEFCLNDGVTHRDGTARREHHFLPQAHVFVRWRGIPIDPGDTELGRVRRSNRDGHYVFRADLNEVGDIKFVTAESAGDRVRARELFAIDPDVGPVVDAAKRKPDALAFVGRGNGKFLAIPPRHSVWAVVGNFVVCELAPDFVADAGDGPQVHAIVRIFVHSVFDEHGKNSFGCGSRVPAFRGEAGDGDLFRRSGYSCGRLDFPTVAKNGAGIGKQNGTERSAKNKARTRTNKKLVAWVSLKPFVESHAPPLSAIKPIEYSLKCCSVVLTLRSVAAHRGQYKRDKKKALHAERFFLPRPETNYFA